MKNFVRNLLSIRKERRPYPLGPAPKVGSEIVLGDIKMKITHPISSELWSWLTLSGWRSVPVSQDRRRNTMLPDNACRALVAASPQEREQIYARLMRRV